MKADAPTKDDVAEILRIVRLHLPSAPARQMLAELSRTKLADRQPVVREACARLVAALDAETGTDWRYA